MMTRSVHLYSVCLFTGVGLLVLLGSCVDEPSSPTDESPISLAIDAQSNSLRVSGTASSLDANRIVPLDLVQRPYECVLTVSNYGSGGGEIILNASPGVALFIDSLSGNHQTRFQIPPNLRISELSLSLHALSADVLFEVNPIGLNILERADFPNDLGNAWTYRISDSSRSTFDTLVVTVIGLRRQATGEGIAKIWTFDYRAWGSVDTLFVFEHSGTTYFSYTTSTWPSILMLRLPLTVGTLLPTGSGGAVGYRVENVDTVSAPAGVFDSSYRHTSLPIDDIECNSSYYMWWVQPRIGIVRRNNYFCHGGTKQYWLLMSFNTPYHSNS